MTHPNIPEGYRQNARGDLVLESKIKPIDLARDQLVQEKFEKAQALSSALRAFKDDTFADIQAFVEMSGEIYGAKLGGQKGNVSLVSFDGRYKIQRAIAESLTFDERLQAAKSLIDECIHNWSQGANDNIRVLVNDAFQVDKEGNINTGRVLGLRRLNIVDEKWNKAMDAISDAVQVTGSKSYLRFYERVGDTDQWKPLALDMASV
ncbi:DUF3164 family protein [Methylobacillus flagellatus]|uniref:Sulfate transport protein CysZ n=1 Tax=Methylobacillus flagellatus (strain ATCC 51484 / DSM 6875 / VKM B-1610 / KT) TaxID=265072 RepID=Q1GXQ3_METFK|nr:DUF3164 family protein [Methylobacillus flagellatus]ABE50984.1 conserved hypothetical protein [Methylobacillus flagellatus KT]